MTSGLFYFEFSWRKIICFLLTHFFRVQYSKGKQSPSVRPSVYQGASYRTLRVRFRIALGRFILPVLSLSLAKASSIFFQLTISADFSNLSSISFRHELHDNPGLEHPITVARPITV